MGKRDKKRKLAGPWENLQTAVWLIGLAILFYKGWWWPGILVLVGISMGVEALVSILAPQAVVEEELQPLPQPPAIPAPVPVPVSQPPASLRQEQPTGRLPVECPKCGGPVRSHEITWTGSQSVACPYCGANLPLKPA